MNKLEKYTSYRDSGIHTSIQVPEHWNIKRFKHLFSFGKGLNITKENLEDTGIECVNYGEIHSKFGFEVNPDIHELKCVNESYLKKDSKSLLNIGDFIFADTSEDIEGSGNFTHLTGNKTIFAGYHTMICRPKKTLNSKYYAYLFDSKSFRSQLHKKVKGVKVYSITQNILKDTCVWIPEDNEQTKIASFLDEKTAQIDKAISQKEKLIELLKERRQITINEAVTKGLDKAVEFKDSGVEWIGEIPKHWNVEKVKYIFKDSSIKNYGEETPLAATQLYGVVPKDTLDYRTVEANVSDLNTFKLVKENNFVISLRSFEGGIEYSAYKGIISPAYTVMEALQDIAYK
ncbi:MAG: restriction endonuclease subunit S, partial [Epsilonproteobacteria bacterium]|nr:restriction endonuclease subunit S [Campylobacterota bacterium]